LNYRLTNRGLDIFDIDLLYLRAEGLISRCVYLCMKSAINRGDIRKYNMLKKDNTREHKDYIEKAQVKYETLIGFNEKSISKNNNNSNKNK